MLRNKSYFTLELIPHNPELPVMDIGNSRFPAIENKPCHNYFQPLNLKYNNDIPTFLRMSECQSCVGLGFFTLQEWLFQQFERFVFAIDFRPDPQRQNPLRIGVAEIHICNDGQFFIF